jgi:hypothetical protein
MGLCLRKALTTWLGFFTNLPAVTRRVDEHIVPTEVEELAKHDPNRLSESQRSHSSRTATHRFSLQSRMRVSAYGSQRTHWTHATFICATLCPLAVWSGADIHSMAYPITCPVLLVTYIQ